MGRIAQFLRNIGSPFPLPPSPPRAEPGLPSTPRERPQWLRRLLRWLVPWARRRNTDDTLPTRPSYGSGASTAAATAGSDPAAATAAEADPGAAARGASDALQVDVALPRTSTPGGDGASGGLTPRRRLGPFARHLAGAEQRDGGLRRPGPEHVLRLVVGRRPLRRRLDGTLDEGFPHDENVGAAAANDGPWRPEAPSSQPPTPLQRLPELGSYGAPAPGRDEAATSSGSAAAAVPAAAGMAAAASLEEMARAVANGATDSDAWGDSDRPPAGARPAPSSTPPTSLGAYAEGPPGEGHNDAAAVVAAAADGPVPAGGGLDILGIWRMRVRIVDGEEA